MATGASPTSETLAIVTGAAGALGKAYLDELAIHPTLRVAAFTRGHQTVRHPRVEYRDGIDLLEADAVARAIDTLRADQVRRVVLIHPVGKFKFEDHTQEPRPLDQQVLLSNFTTLTNTVIPLIDRIRKDATFVVCGFGSVSDRYDVPFWRSYTAAKNTIRTFLKTIAASCIETGPDTRTVMVNVTTTDTGNENLLRPNADKRYWLKPEKIVAQSVPALFGDSLSFYQEIDVIEAQPGFDPDAYYRNHAAVRAKWLTEMTPPEKP